MKINGPSAEEADAGAGLSATAAKGRVHRALKMRAGRAGYVGVA